MGISCYYHDSALAVVDDDEIRFAIHEERLSRVKHDARFPVLAIGAALRRAATRHQRFRPDRLLRRPAAEARAACGTRSSITGRARAASSTRHPAIRAAQAADRGAAEEASQLSAARSRFSEHHRSHAASAFFTSPFERAVVVTLDGVGEYETAAVHLGEGNRLTNPRSIHFPHSLGLFYSVFTQYLGFEVNEGEYKVMGLAPYGRPRYLDKLLGPILRIDDDGAFRAQPAVLRFLLAPSGITRRRWSRISASPPRRPERPDDARSTSDLAASVQQALEIGDRPHLLPPLIREFGTQRFLLCRRCRAELHRQCADDPRSRHPLAHPSGGGRCRRRARRRAAIDHAGPARTGRPTATRFRAYLGMSYPKAVIRATLSLNNMPYRECNDIAEDARRRLAAGKVVAILHGRDEWGPRALGARSILADPRRAEMKDHLNAKIKFREEFRPFAPVVKEEAYGDWFETLGMTRAPSCSTPTRHCARNRPRR